MCYKDMTFCPFYESCSHGKKCKRALTQDVIDAAAKWFGKAGAPIAEFCEKPDCFNDRCHKTDSELQACEGWTRNGG